MLQRYTVFFSVVERDKQVAVTVQQTSKSGACDFSGRGDFIFKSSFKKEFRGHK